MYRIRKLLLIFLAIISATMILQVKEVKADEDFLKFTAEEANSSVNLKVLQVTSLETSTDLSTWEVYTPGNVISLSNVGSCVYFRGHGLRTDGYNHFEMTGKIKASGSVLSLVDPDKWDSTIQLEERQFDSMFKGCSAMTEAPEIPFTNLAKSCYNCMFYECSSLTKAPALPATTMDGSVLL